MTLTSTEVPGVGSAMIALAPTTVNVRSVAALDAPVVVPEAVVRSSFLMAPASKCRLTFPIGRSAAPMS